MSLDSYRKWDEWSKLVEEDEDPKEHRHREFISELVNDRKARKHWVGKMSEMARNDRERFGVPRREEDRDPQQAPTTSLKKVTLKSTEKTAEPSPSRVEELPLEAAEKAAAEKEASEKAEAEKKVAVKDAGKDVPQKKKISFDESTTSSKPYTAPTPQSSSTQYCRQATRLHSSVSVWKEGTLMGAYLLVALVGPFVVDELFPRGILPLAALFFVLEMNLCRRSRFLHIVGTHGPQVPGNVVKVATVYFIIGLYLLWLTFRTASFVPLLVCVGCMGRVRKLPIELK